MRTGREFDVEARQAGREIRQLRSNMPSFIESAVFLMLLAISVLSAIYVGQTSPTLGIWIGILGTLLAVP